MKAQLEPISSDNYYQLGEDEGLEGYSLEGHLLPRPTIVTRTVGPL